MRLKSTPALTTNCFEEIEPSRYFRSLLENKLGDDKKGVYTELRVKIGRSFLIDCDPVIRKTLGSSQSSEGLFRGINIAHPPKEPWGVDALYTYCSWPIGRRPTYRIAIGLDASRPPGIAAGRKLEW